MKYLYAALVDSRVVGALLDTGSKLRPFNAAAVLCGSSPPGVVQIAAFDVTLFEASDRFGGAAHTAYSPTTGEGVELGVQVLLDKSIHVLQFFALLNVTTYREDTLGYAGRLAETQEPPTLRYQGFGYAGRLQTNNGGYFSFFNTNTDFPPDDPRGQAVHAAMGDEMHRCASTSASSAGPFPAPEHTFAHVTWE